MLGTLPVDGLPPVAQPARVLLEVWTGEAPPVVPGTAPVAFDVEGTIIGDGRSWSGARWSALPDDVEPDLSAGTPEHQLLVLRPAIERWA